MFIDVIYSESNVKVVVLKFTSQEKPVNHHYGKAVGINTS